MTKSVFRTGLRLAAASVPVVLCTLARRRLVPAPLGLTALLAVAAPAAEWLTERVVRTALDRRFPALRDPGRRPELPAHASNDTQPTPRPRVLATHA